MKNVLLYCLFILTIFSCNSKKEKVALGELNHQFNISEKSRESFDKGLLLLHSFEYQDAREAFKTAYEEDNAEVMALWGEAMSHYRALWGLEDLEAGREVMLKLGPDKNTRLSSITDLLEKDFWQGIEILYGEGERAERHLKYREHMKNVYEKRSGNQEVAAFYSLGLMWSVGEGRDDEVFSRSAEVAAGILEENPIHPGGLHYMIHAYDDPEYAKYAKLAADSYSKVAPDATHALHMPSHIYVALGMWDEVVSSNENSYAASLARMKRKELDGSARGYHSFAWLHYGYLQQGRFEKAATMVKEMQQYNEEVNNPSTQSYLIVMQAAQLSETGTLGELEYYSAEYDRLGITDKARQHFTRSYLAYQNNDSEAINSEIDTLMNYLVTAELSVGEGGIALCSAAPARYAPNKYDIFETKAIIQQMEAFIDLLENNKEAAEAHLVRAVEFEAQSGYSFGPPDIPLPSYEQYADLLYQQGRYDEALEQLDLSLKQAPNRTRAMDLKKKILRKQGLNEEADKLDDVLIVFWQGDDINKG